MTAGEFSLFVTELESTFRGDLAEDREAAIAEHFGRVPFEEARLVVRRLVADGQVWTPTPGELVRALKVEAGGRWHFLRLMQGRSVEEQREFDRAASVARIGERRELAQ